MCPPTTDNEYYFNMLTGQVEHGQLSSWTHRMGPYPTEEAARHAFELARKRTEAWDEDDRAWGDEDDDSDD